MVDRKSAITATFGYAGTLAVMVKIWVAQTTNGLKI
jgi:hypothetical protein